MSIQVKQMLGVSLAGAALAVAAGCSKSDKAPVAEAPPPAPVVLPNEISIPGTAVFPESFTASADGSIYIGSVGKGEVYRVKPAAATAEPFIAAATGGIKQVFGVLADDSSGTLWLCSNQVTFGRPPGATPSPPGELHSFDLATGAARASYVFPAGGMCNDIAVGANGDVYASDTMGMQVMRLPKGATALEVWSPKDAFGKPGGVLDGIAVVGGRVVVNTLVTSKLFAVDVGADGKAGKVTELALSAGASTACAAPAPPAVDEKSAKPAPAPLVLTRPDGMRAYGSDSLLSTDGTGKIQLVKIDGDKAEVTCVKDGLDGVVAVATVGKKGYALEGQLGLMMGPPGGSPPAEKPYHAVGFDLP